MPTSFTTTKKHSAKEEQIFAYLYEDLSDMLSLSHEPECLFHVVSLECGGIERAHFSRCDPVLHELSHGRPVRVAGVHQSVKVDAMEGGVL